MINKHNFYKIIICYITTTTIVFCSPAFAKNDNTIPNNPTTLTQGVLDNKMPYYIFKVPGAGNRVDIRLKINAGAVDEMANKFGSAHMLEHVLLLGHFQSSKLYPQGASVYMRDAGWKLGRHYNGHTIYDKTVFSMSPPKGIKQLPQALRIIKNIVFKPVITEKALKIQRNVVLAEWRDRNTINDRMRNNWNKVLTRGSREARSSILGNRDDIINLKLKTLKDFHARWYAPNNAKLIVVVGDVEIAPIVSEIKKQFSSIAMKKIPVRGKNYYEPKLSKGWFISQFQDIDIPVNAVGTIYRSDNSDSKIYTGKDKLLGIRNRVIDKYALKIISRRLEKLEDNYSKDVGEVTILKHDIGRHTTAVLMLAGLLTTDGYNKGLYNIFQAQKYLLNTPIQQDEIDSVNKIIQDDIKKNKNRPTYPTKFDEVVMYVMKEVVGNTPLHDRNVRMRTIGEIAPHITPAIVQKRIKLWLSADDKTVNYIVRKGEKITPPTVDDIKALIFKVSKQKTIVPVAEKPNQTFFNKVSAGTITDEVIDKDTNITKWGLSNGDTVIWMKKPVAKDKAYFIITAPIGFMSSTVSPWKSVMANTEVSNSLPQGFNLQGFKKWQRETGVDLEIELKDSNWEIRGHSNTNNLFDAFKMYQAYLNNPKVDNDEFEKERLFIMNSYDIIKNSADFKKTTELMRLLYGKVPVFMPSMAKLNEVKALTKNDLIEQWNILAKTPVTYYIVSNAKYDDMKKTVQNTIVNINRTTQDFTTDTILDLKGNKTKSIHLDIEPKTEVYMHSWDTQKWSPQKEMLLNISSKLAEDRLYRQMRQKELGVYSILFDSKLSPKNNRIKTKIYFNTKFGTESRMLQVAKETLSTITADLTQDIINDEKNWFMMKEKDLLKDPKTWLSRLKISYQNYGDYRYLKRMHKLADNITIDNVKKTMNTLWNNQNQRVFIVIPKDDSLRLDR